MTPFDLNDKSRISKLFATIPSQPGVYRFLNKDGEVIYVGKARQLKRRLRQYFSSSVKEAKVTAMMRQACDVNYTITETEGDALLLEATQIKAYKPRYNIILRDDKSYPYLLLSNDKAYPRFDFIRSPKKTSSRGELYGPYPTLGSAKEALVLLQKCFKLRNCRDAYFNNRTRPCLQYQIQRCTGPCVGKISEADYHKDVAALKAFLSGKGSTALQRLTQDMEHAAANHQFERAALLRDQIAALRGLQAQQLISVKKQDCDAIAAKIIGQTGYVTVVYVRNGEVILCQPFQLQAQKHTLLSELVEQFILQKYMGDSPADRIAPTLLLPIDLEDRSWVEQALSEKAGHKVQLKIQLNPQEKHFCQMAKRNLDQAIAKKIQTDAVIEERLQALAHVLGLLEPIQQIECFDISHTQGEAARAACVIYNKKGHDKQSYRLFSLRDITPGDDVAAIGQAVFRRYQRLLKEAKPLPEVLLIDGGRTQMQAALDSLEKLGVDSILVLGISKGSARKAGMERIFVSTKQLLQLDPHDPSFHLLQAVRDEAHRFSLKTHRNKRAKNSLQSVLESIEGVGPKKRQALLAYFGGLKAIRKASVTEIARVPGINAALAERIRACLLHISG